MAAPIIGLDDFLDDRRRFRELMDEILGLIRSRSTSRAVDNANSTGDKKKISWRNNKIRDRSEILRILRNIYDSCNDTVDGRYECEEINCDAEYCSRNEDLRATLTEESDWNFDASMQSNTSNERPHSGPEIENNVCSASECGNPISIVIYAPGRNRTNRCGRRRRLESRNASRYSPMSVTQHFVSPQT